MSGKVIGYMGSYPWIDPGNFFDEFGYPVIYDVTSRKPEGIVGAPLGWTLYDGTGRPGYHGRAFVVTEDFPLDPEYKKQYLLVKERREALKKAREAKAKSKSSG